MNCFNQSHQLVVPRSGAYVPIRQIFSVTAVCGNAFSCKEKKKEEEEEEEKEKEEEEDEKEEEEEKKPQYHLNANFRCAQWIKRGVGVKVLVSFADKKSNQLVAINGCLKNASAAWINNSKKIRQRCVIF